MELTSSREESLSNESGVLAGPGVMVEGRGSQTELWDPPHGCIHFVGPQHLAF